MAPTTEVIEIEGGELSLTVHEGSLIVHGAVHEGDVTGFARLWLKARTRAKELGFKEAFIHVDAPELEPFYERQGFEKIMTIYRKEL